MSTKYSSTVNTARDYYNSNDADHFYFQIWGGEDIHIGLYESPSDSISAASRRTVERMASMPANLGPKSHVLDLGSGYGGAARFLADRYGCKVTAINLSEVENIRNRELTEQQSLSHLVDVVDGNFEDLPFPDGTFDLVWSQDAILHSGNRADVIGETVRVMREGADFVFTDPMQADNCPEGVLQPILDRIHLETLGSPAFYRRTAAKCGLQEVAFHEMTPQLVNHYSRVLEETQSRESELRGTVSQDYLDRMKRGLQYWIDGGNQGHLTWGIFHFHKAQS